MNNSDLELLNIISNTSFDGAYNIRKNGHCIKKGETDNIKIKSNDNGIDIYVIEDTHNEIVSIPVIIDKSINDVVVNNIYIGDNSSITIYAGCGIDNNECNTNSLHSGSHNFIIGNNCKVKYIEKHYGRGKSNKIFNPSTNIKLGKHSEFELDAYQIRGVDSSVRKTNAVIGKCSKLIINEKLSTYSNEKVKSIFKVKLNGKDSKCELTSRSVAVDNSIQEFVSSIYGNNECFAKVECDSIIDDNAKVSSTPKIVANDKDAKLIHEATIGKIAGEELIKLMTLGLTKKEAEETIINGFLK